MTPKCCTEVLVSFSCCSCRMADQRLVRSRQETGRSSGPKAGFLVRTNGAVECPRRNGQLPELAILTAERGRVWVGSPPPTHTGTLEGGRLHETVVSSVLIMPSRAILAMYATLLMQFGLRAPCWQTSTPETLEMRHIENIYDKLGHSDGIPQLGTPG